MTDILTDEQIRAEAQRLLATMISESVLTDANEASAWVVETIDPDLDPADPGHRKLHGPFPTPADALHEAHRIETQVNPEVAQGGYSALTVSVVPVLRD